MLSAGTALGPMPIGADSGRVVAEYPAGHAITDTWSRDGRWIYFVQSDSSVRVSRMDLRSGRLEPWKTIRFPDRTGLEIHSAALSDDGECYAVGYKRLQSELFLMEGLR